MNLIWTAMISASVIFALSHGSDAAQAVTRGLLDGAENAVAFALSLVGVLAFWSGMLKLAEESGVTKLFVRLLSPVVRRLFPSVPAHHPAGASILMALSANLLGLGNAATPLGLKAMEHLADLNHDSEEASDAMCTFLALNTSSLTLLPGTVIAIRAVAGSNHPAAIVGTTIVATLTSTLTAVVLDRILRRGRRRG